MEVAAELAMAERDMTALRLESEPAGSIIDELDGQRAVWHDVTCPTCKVPGARVSKVRQWEFE